MLARGVAKQPVPLEYTLPFCVLRGRLVAWKHGGIEEELSAATNALQRLGGRPVGIYPVAVTGHRQPHSGGGEGKTHAEGVPPPARQPHQSAPIAQKKRTG